MTKVKASGSDTKANKCLEGALEGAPTKSPDAVCAATLWRDQLAAFEELIDERYATMGFTKQLSERGGRRPPLATSL